MQSFKTQEKWQSAKASHHRTRIIIFIKSIHSDLGIFIPQTCDKFHSSVSSCCLAGRTQAHHYHSYFVRAHIHCSISALGNESISVISVFKIPLLSISERKFTINWFKLHVYLTFSYKSVARIYLR